jgi:hypothetical protein
MEFDQRSATYIDDAGQKISRGFVRFEAEIHAQSIASDLRKLTTTALDQSWDADRFEAQFISTLKDGYIRLAILGKGGKENMTPSDYGKIGASLKAQYKRLYGFTDAMVSGNVSIGQAGYRAAMYGNNSVQIYSEMELRALSGSNMQFARRSLTPGFAHCQQCISYVTFPAWFPVDEVTPIAVDCDCRGHCKCTIEYSANPPVKLRARSA